MFFSFYFKKIIKEYNIYSVGDTMKKMIGILILIVFLAACIELPEKNETIKEIKEESVPTPDYSIYEEEYQRVRDEIKKSFPEGEKDGRIAVLRIHGILDVEDVLPITKHLREIAESDAQGVILWIDSPGGSVAAVTQITYEILRFKEKKPIISYVGGYGASGAYYISSVCNKIIARGDADVGSIGVIYVHVDASEYYRQYGFEFDIIKTGKHKDAGADWRSLTEEEREWIKNSVYDAFYRFIFTVAKGRNLSYDYVKAYADGLTWSGKDAVNAKLIDAVGNFDTAVDEIRSLTGLNNPELVFIEEKSFGSSESWDALRYQLPLSLIRDN